MKNIVPELSLHFDMDMIVLEKWERMKPISILYFEGDKKKYYIKRFLVDESNKEELILSDHPDSQLIQISTDYRPVAEVSFSKRSLVSIKVDFEEFIAIKGIKALGNIFSTEKIKDVTLLESLTL